MIAPTPCHTFDNHWGHLADYLDDRREAALKEFRQMHRQQIWSVKVQEFHLAFAFARRFSQFPPANMRASHVILAQKFGR